MKKFVFAVVLTLALFSLMYQVRADVYTSVNYQQPVVSYSSSDYNTYWPAITNQMCQGRQDVILSVPPAGCQPTVVRSDLLSQQNVPVFCQVSALQINPLIDIKSIDSISFGGSQYPSEVVGTGFHPAQVALGSSYSKLSGNPVMSNIGYVVVILKREPNESALPDSVNLNLTARITYNAGNAFGIGQASFTIPVMNDAEWNGNASAHSLQSFWQGRYFVRAESASSNDAIISIYYGNNKISTVHVLKGQTSSDILIPGFSSCDASLQVAYDGFQQDADHARLEVSDDKGTDVIDAYASGSSIFNGGPTQFYNGQCKVQNVNLDSDGVHGSVDIICGNQQFTLALAKSSSQSKTLGMDSSSLKYYQAALQSYTDVATKYPAESNGQSTYGQQALEQAINLAQEANDVKAETTLINLMLETYPNNDASRYRDMLSHIQDTDFSSSSATVQINNKLVNIRLVNFVKSSADASADILVGGNLIKGATMSSSISLGGFGSAKISSISPDQVSIYASCNSVNTQNSGSNSATLSEGASATLCGTVLRLNKINDNKLVSVRILPNVHNTETDTNLSVNVGIEKRSIQLSPAKTQEMITNLNATIQKWEKISSTLGKAVTGLKAACFATAAVLTAKNFLGGVNGASLARQKVMQGNNGWTAKCQEAFKSGVIVPGLSGQQPYVSVDDCLNQNAAAINNDVSKATNVLNSVNTQLVQNDKSATQSSSLFGSSVDTEKSAEATLADIQSKFGNDQTSIPVNGNQETIGHFVTNVLSIDAYKNNIISYNDIRDFYYYAQLVDTPGISDVQKSAAVLDLSGIMSRAEQNQKQFGAGNTAKSATNSFYTSPIDSYASNPNAAKGNYYGDIYKQGSITDSSGSDLNSYGNGKPFKEIIYNQQLYALILTNNGQGTTYTIDGNHVYKIDTSSSPPLAYQASDADIGEIKKIVSQFQKIDASFYTNRYINPEVKYWETDPYKGMPAIVPIDTSNGWYAATEQTLPVFGQQGAFESSGKVSSFWLCNVGKNGQEEFDKTGKGDDTCQQFNLNTGQTTTFFPGLSQTQTNALVQKAIAELNNVARQHVDGIKSVKLSNGQSISVGAPAVNVPTAQCQDYMSPQECQLLFNVCDPVICPASRCNLGGQYPVSDVPQTGIIGSTLLCLPNAREGIAVPVCLTGIQSGIDGFVSLLKNHRDCLQESLDTGQMVGICDQIYSVYACEFFWNQVAPVAKLLLPKLVETAYGQGTRGGGEYLTVMAAWQNTQQAINYFTQQYAVNSMQAFQSRSLNEFGDQFCKAFVSVSAPKTFQALVQPDSPPQFNAWFSSTAYSDVTVPATSQYKVFYHIYAGKDTGVYYEVYLKNPPQTSYYSTAQTVLVASGFAAAGQYASETKDFTAPEGYQELCVRINDQEQCGFKQVSTSFAVNYVADSVAQNAITSQGITTESGCVSGDPSMSSAVGSLMTGSIQGAAQSAISPQIYNSGIIRICSTSDPGSASSPGRFVDVGYCGDQNVRCWLDTNSVTQAISNMSVGMQSATITQLQQTANSAIGAQQVITDSSTAQGALDSIDSSIQQLDTGDSQTLSSLMSSSDSIISSLKNLQPELLLSSSEARASFLLGQVNQKVAEFAISQYQKVSNTATQQKQNALKNQVADLKTKLSQLQTLQTALTNPNTQGLATGSLPNLVYVSQALQLGAITQSQYDDLVGKFSILSPATWFANSISDLIPYVNTAISNTQAQIDSASKSAGVSSSSITASPVASGTQTSSVNSQDVSSLDINSIYLLSSYDPTLADTSQSILYDTSGTIHESGLYLKQGGVYYQQKSGGQYSSTKVGSISISNNCLVSGSCEISISPEYSGGNILGIVGFDQAVAEQKILQIINGVNPASIKIASSSQKESLALSLADIQLHTMPVQTSQTQGAVNLPTYTINAESVTGFLGSVNSLYYDVGLGSPYDLHIVFVPSSSGGSIYALDRSGSYNKFGTYDSSGTISLDSGTLTLVNGYASGAGVAADVQDRFSKLLGLNGKSLKDILSDASPLLSLSSK